MIMSRCHDMSQVGGNWPVFDWCNQFLQTRAELMEATRDLLHRLAEDGVVYAEVRLTNHHVVED